MTDRELLQKAARAAGYAIDEDLDRTDVRDNGGGPRKWNPLEDDGDALRLAVGLGISVIHHARSVTASVPMNCGQQAARIEFESGKRLDAARRAIVIAAAGSKTPNDRANLTKGAADEA